MVNVANPLLQFCQPLMCVDLVDACRYARETETSSEAMMEFFRALPQHVLIIRSDTNEFWLRPSTPVPGRSGDAVRATRR